ncbi:MAG: hypothetical protein JO247_20270 [Chloroflexi bacterium]|nr:hypothetical protein [Chloroflexota bacterium]
MPRPSSGGRGLALTLLPSPHPQPAPPAPSWSFTPAPSGATPAPIAPIQTSGKLGIGLYGGIPFGSLLDMKPNVFLVEDPSPDASQQLRHVFPNALIVGRHFVQDGDPSLANCSDGSENHQAKGAAFADLIAQQAIPLKGVVDAWVSDNETASSAEQADLPCHAAFQVGFVERLQHTYGIDAVAGDDATGAVEPADYVTYFSRAISEAAYFGLHAYGKPGATTLQTPDAQYYALRYRMVHDALVQAGVRLPRGGFLLTETGLYDGWRGAVSDQAMASDFLWLDQQLQQDDYVRGQMIFGLGLFGRFTNFDLQGTSVPALLGAH